jgi:hypothetical protein
MSEETRTLGSLKNEISDSEIKIDISSKNIKELEKKNITSVKVKDNSNLSIGNSEQSVTDHKIIMGKGVVMIMKNNNFYFISNLWYFVGIIMTISIFTIAFVAYFLQKQDIKTVIREKIVRAPIKSKSLKLIKTSNKKSDIEDEKEKNFKIFNSLEPIFEIIELDGPASIKIFKEAVHLRKKGNEEEEFDPKESRRSFKQAIIRLRALLQKGEITNYYRLQTAYQLWVIYHCHLTRYKKAAKKMKNLVKTYNRGISKKVRFSCPKL